MKTVFRVTKKPKEKSRKLTHKTENREEEKKVKFRLWNTCTSDLSQKEYKRKSKHLSISYRPRITSNMQTLKTNYLTLSRKDNTA